MFDRHSPFSVAASPPLALERLSGGRSYPLPHDEQERLAELHRYRILDTAPQDIFDDIVRLAKSLFSVDVALISLVDDERQWFKAKIGIDVCETGRDVAFCTYAILENDVFLVPDASADPRFAHNPLVTDEPFIRFYAGAPLRTGAGFNLGTLCIFDAQPRFDFSAADLQHLAALATIVTERMLVRRFSLEREEQSSSFLVIAEELTASAALLGAQSRLLTDMATESARRSDEAAADVRLLRETGEIVNTALTSIAQNIATANLDVETTFEAMRSMDIVVDGIGKVAGEIASIAAESKMLSINASIEACRAGKESLGFGAVAGEVKQLATKTSAATRNIVGELESVATKVAIGVRHCERLNGTIGELSRTAHSIAQQAVVQRKASDRVLIDVENMAETTARVQDEAVGVGDASERLIAHAATLKLRAVTLQRP